MRGRRWMPALLLALLAGAACGTRLDRSEIERGAFGPQAGTGQAALAGSVSPAGGTGSEPSAEAGSAGLPSGAGSIGSTGSLASPSSTGGTGAATAGRGRASASTGGTSSGPDSTGPATGAGSGGPASASGGSSGAAGAPSATPGAGGAAPAARGGDQSPVVVGNVGTYSGPVGSSEAPGQTGVLTWAKWVNDHGGVNGHPVKVISADDQNDPTRNLSLVKDMVENQKVVAFVGNMVPLTINGSLKYLEEKRVPVLGGEITAEEWNQSPMLFPQNAAPHQVIAGMARLAKQVGGTKYGLLYCAEARICQVVYDRLFTGGELQKAGVEPTYSAKVSITQPDYTAECLQAKSKGVDVMAVAADSATVGRVASSCARQGFTPKWTSQSVAVNASLAENPALEGLQAVLPSFPWTVTGHPGVDEYRQAVARFAPKLEGGVPAAQGWTAGKLLETILGRITGPVTTPAVLDALWSLRSETLGGLTSPLTFARNQPAPEANCYFVIKIQGGKWVAPTGMQQSCVS